MREPEWKDFRKWVITTMTHDRDAKVYRDPNFVSPGVAREFMLDHPVWGLAARPALMPAAAKAAVEVGELNPAMEPLARINAGICATGLGLAARNDYQSIRRFIDLWSPRGPLAIEGEAWKHDPGFVGWWARQEGL
jgi:hypothetical protein